MAMMCMPLIGKLVVRRFLVVVVAAVASTLAALGQSEPIQDLDALRDTALHALNGDRSEQGLPPLEYGDALNAAALRHAEDMADRNYYSHLSPDGNSVQDRYEAAGGSEWVLTAENIARCTGCSPTQERVEELQRGWMDSPEHRANILAEGLETFGFGMALDSNDTLYAVQTFSGPGTPRGAQPEEDIQPLPPDEQGEKFAEVMNEARISQGLKRLEISAQLTAAAIAIISTDEEGMISLNDQSDLYDALPAGGQRRWSALSTVSGVCGGCGSEPVVSDIEAFAGDWLDQQSLATSLLSEQYTHLGFRLAADGTGKKIAVAILGARR
jgi:uncharacterized protein YkwD